MNKVLRWTFSIVLVLILGYYGLGYLSSYIGWNGYKKWEYRVATSDISESKQRNVFVKELNFKIDSFPDTLTNFKVYIEKGFKYGRNSSSETVQLTNSHFPYQLSFHYKINNELYVFIRETELKKFDSANSSWGYLKNPELPDTIILEIRGPNIHSGVIKVW